MGMTTQRVPGTRRVDFDALYSEDDRPNRPEGWHYITVEVTEEPDSQIFVAYWDKSGRELRRDMMAITPGSAIRFTRDDIA